MTVQLSLLLLFFLHFSPAVKGNCLDQLGNYYPAGHVLTQLEQGMIVYRCDGFRWSTMGCRDHDGQVRQTGEKWRKDRFFYQCKVSQGRTPVSCADLNNNEILKGVDFRDNERLVRCTINGRQGLLVPVTTFQPLPPPFVINPTRDATCTSDTGAVYYANTVEWLELSNRRYWRCDYINSRATKVAVGCQIGNRRVSINNFDCDINSDGSSRRDLPLPTTNIARCQDGYGNLMSVGVEWLDKSHRFYMKCQLRNGQAEAIKTACADISFARKANGQEFSDGGRFVRCIIDGFGNGQLKTVGCIDRNGNRIANGATFVNWDGSQIRCLFEG